jgi:predicted peptidase
MENLGYITEFDGVKGRRVLITQDEYDKLYGLGEKKEEDEPALEFEIRTHGKMQYLIRYPKGYKVGVKYPTVFLFHGAGARGTNVRELMGNDFFTVAAKRDDYPFVTVAAQCHEETWFDLFETVKSFVQEVTGYGFCDRKRVYAIGYSMGGYAVWQLGISMPWMFAAIVPICGGGMYWNASRFKDLPVWAFHGEKDETVKVEESKKMVDAINACGGNAKLTIYPEVAHHSWENAYVEPELFNWLLSHAKNK